MRIEAFLPAFFWREFVEAAVYTLNRTPTRSLGWKTPFEAVTGRKPSLAHLRVYGCRAYALKPKIPRKDKLAERAHVGYLVGYNSTNIFKLYVPSLNKVIRVRDITFNESLAYDDLDPDLGCFPEEIAKSSASVLDVVTVDCLYAFQSTAAPKSLKTKPAELFLVIESSAKDASAAHSNASW